MADPVLVYNPDDEPLEVTYAAVTYVLPANTVFGLPSQEVADHVLNAYGQRGVTQVSDLAPTKEEIKAAEDTYIKFISAFVKRELEAYAAKAQPFLTAGVAPPKGSSSYARALALAKRYAGRLSV